MVNAFKRYYARVVYFGIMATIWFAVMAHGAYDIWSATLLFSAITILALVFILGRLLDKKPVKLPLLLSLTLFLFALSLSTIRSFDVESSWLELWGWVFTVLLYYLFINSVEDSSEGDHFFVWTGSIVLILAGICAWQQGTLEPNGYGQWQVPLTWLRPGWVSVIRYGHWEIHATLVNSVVLAGFVLYWPLLYWQKARKDPRYAILFVACLFILVLARSWWSGVGLMMGFGLLYRSELRKFAGRHPAVALCAGTGLVFALALILSMKLHHTEEDIANLAYYHANSRWFYLRSALAMWRSRPWTGVGLGGFATAYPYFKIGAGENTRLAHCYPLQILAETGWAGAAAGLLCIGHYVRIRLGHALRQRHSQVETIWDITLLIICCFSLISINMDYLVNRLTFFIMLGATLIASPSAAYRARPFWLGTGMVCLILFCPLWMSLFTASRLYVSAEQFERQGNLMTAGEVYRDAISVEPFHADSYWRLFQLQKARFEESHSPFDYSEAQTYLRQAIRFKKDPRFMAAAIDFEKQSTPPLK